MEKQSKSKSQRQIREALVTSVAVLLMAIINAQVPGRWGFPIRARERTQVKSPPPPSVS
jgi:hypothetical protein